MMQFETWLSLRLSEISYRRKPVKRGTSSRGLVSYFISQVPNLLTIARLFFGCWSVLLAFQNEFYKASWWIIIAGVLDLLDGLWAKMTKSATAFGAELDLLVDILCFGMAPAGLMYFLIFLHEGPFIWIFSFLFVACVALRLAESSTQQRDEHNSGLTSPVAGMTLATYYPFSQTTFYQLQLANLPWSQFLIFLTAFLSLAMVSNIRFVRLPGLGLRTPRQLLGLGIHLILLSFVIWRLDLFCFPLALAHLSYGIAKWTGVNIRAKMTNN